MEKPLELWGGLECTVNRVSDQYFSQLDKNGHAGRDDDIARFASLGIKVIRYPFLWERIAPDGIDKADWCWTDQRLAALAEHGIAPIAGLIHHGSGPRHTSLVAPDFASGLAEFAGAVARRYPQLQYYTPVNEPLTTARFSGLYGVWYPHGRDERTFLKALFNQCRATVLAMRAVRQVNPLAKLVQTDDLGKSYGTPELHHLAAFYNERRWLGWDLLCGMVNPQHALWHYLIDSGMAPQDILWFSDNPCPPDIIGLNYYVTSERWLDHRTSRYLDHHCGMAGGRPFADIEAARALATPTPGIGPLLREVWDRYHLPMAVTEAHIDANREDQLRWLLEIWAACMQLCGEGVDVRAVTVWALLGSYDWNSLVTSAAGYYEPGPFDVRATPPRPTALATMMRELAAGQPLSHPVLKGQGWWRRPGRFLCPPVATRAAPASLCIEAQALTPVNGAPILIAGASGTLGRAFATLCEQRNLSYVLSNRQDMDISSPDDVERTLARFRPWAVVNACGYVRVDDAETDASRCHRENAVGPGVLATLCAKHGVHLLSFSSDLVFGEGQCWPFVEADAVAPLSAYGRSKVAAEYLVRENNPDALIVRTSAFFGPWDRFNFVSQSLQGLAAGSKVIVASDLTMSPTYVPDLVNACLDLLIDRESGIWHLTNGDAVTWEELSRRAAAKAGIDASGLDARPAAHCRYAAKRPMYSALGSTRGLQLPSLDDAIDRYLTQQRRIAPSWPQARHY